MDPVLSIIIPAYNEEKSIERTVRQFSGLRVSHEVIVADSKSDDRTVEIAKKSADRVVLLAPEKKSGVSPSRNNGAAAARGKFLIFMDSDTVMPEPNAFIAIALKRFEDDPKLVGLSSRVEIRSNVATTSDNMVSFLMNANFFILNKLFHVGIASGKFIMVRAEIFKKIGGFDERLKTAEDVDFFGKLPKLGHTRIAWNLAVYHEGRRFHALGAWRTLYHWIANAISYWLFNKSSDTWEPVR